MEKSAFCCVGLVNPKSPENVGSVMRAAGCYGVDEVYYTGNRFELDAKLGFLLGAFKDRIESEIVKNLDELLAAGSKPAGRKKKG